MLLEIDSGVNIFVQKITVMTVRRFYNGIGNCNRGGVILDLSSTHHYSNKQGKYVLSPPRIFKINMQGVSIRRMSEDGYYHDWVRSVYLDKEALIGFNSTGNLDIVNMDVLTSNNRVTFQPPRYIQDISIYCKYIDEDKFNVYIYIDGVMVLQKENTDDRYLKLFLNPAATIDVRNLYTFESMDNFIVSEVENVGD